MKRLSVLGPVLVLLGVLPPSCSLRGGTRSRPLPSAATSALAEARELLRSRPAGWRALAEEAVARAAQAAPEWIGPERVRDDLLREDLLGHLALAERRSALDPTATAEELYLAGRLEGRAGGVHLERAARLDPSLSWAQHGLAWQLFQSGQLHAALRAGERAVELARGSYELGSFAVAEARYLADLGRDEEACAELADVLGDERLAEPERTEVEAALARAELASDETGARDRGFWRAVHLLENGHLSASEYEELGEQALLHRAALSVGDPLSVLLAALEGGRGEAHDRLLGRVLLERGAHALARSAVERSGGMLAAGPFQRARDLERGAAEEALARWCAALPAALKDDEGLPRLAALRALVLSSRSVADPDGGAGFGAALLAAGWFEEAESWASALAERDPDAALSVATGAARGQALLAGVRALLEHVDEERAAFVPARTGPPGEERTIENLDQLLGALQPLFERYHGGPLASALSASPRLSFGAFAAIVHPGPSFSAQDEALGLGAKGSPVPGLAHELALLGRFGIFGRAPGGGGPDGTVLRLVGGEWKEGEHLGVPFSGWVAWCEGADIESRPGRLGSGVSGAALHEGYWIDLDSVRSDWERLKALEQRHLEGEPEIVRRALAERGPALAPGAPEEDRTRWIAPLGEGERVFLAAMAERDLPRAGSSRLSFEELLANTALHEEGHLTDRTRFLPLSAKWPKALAFLLRYGATPHAVARALEYRAQLVALCEADEPRLVLADCLMAADSESRLLSHGEAYRALLEDFLAQLQRERMPALEEGGYLLYQLHTLARDDVRRVARALAARHGMLAE